MNSWRGGPPGYPPEAPYMHHMPPHMHRPPGIPVKEEVYPYGDNVKAEPDHFDGKYMSPGGQLKQEPDIKPPLLHEDGGRMAYPDQSQGRKRSLGPPFKDEDPSIPKRSRFEQIRFDDQSQEHSDQSVVTLDTYNSDLSLKIDDSRLSASRIDGECFAYMWHGVRATYGFTRGRICFEVMLEQNIPMPEMEMQERHPHVLRVGWSLDECGFTLGEEPFSWGYGGTGKASTNLKFKDYGCQFKAGDVVGAYLDLDMEPAVMSFTVNGNHQGIAYELRKFDLKGRPIFPHILTKNIRFSVNFGDSPQPMGPILQGYTFAGKVPLAQRVQGSIGPAGPDGCEVIMMVGLPASGKTTWVNKYTSENRHMKYNVLGSNDLLDKMKVDGLARKRNYSGRWDQLISVCMQGLNKLLQMSYNTPRNYIIDQTNVYQSARKRKMKGFGGYRRRAVVICPSDDNLKGRTAKREKEEGKEVPDSAVYEMKVNFTLPDDSEPFDSVEYIELKDEEAQALVAQYNEEGFAMTGKRPQAQRGGRFQRGRGRGGGGRGWNRDNDNRGGGASHRGGGPEGFSRGGRGSSTFDRLGGFVRGGGGPDRFGRGRGGPDRFNRDEGPSRFNRGGGTGADRQSPASGPDSFSKRDGPESFSVGDIKPNDFAQGGRGDFNKPGGPGGFNRDASEDLLGGNGTDGFNRDSPSFSRGRGFNNFSRGRAPDRFGAGAASEENGRGGGGPGRFGRGGGGAADTYGRGGRGGGADTYGRGGGADTYGRGGGEDTYGRGEGGDTYGRGGGGDTYGRGGGGDTYGRGGGGDTYGRGGGDTYGRGGGGDTYGRGGGGDTYGRGGGTDTYGRGGDGANTYESGGADNYGRGVGGGADTYGRGGAAGNYGQGGGGADTYGQGGGGADTYGRGGGGAAADTYGRGGGGAAAAGTYGQGGGADTYGRGGGGGGAAAAGTYGRGGADSYGRGGADTYTRGGGSDSYSRADGSDGRGGSDGFGGDGTGSSSYGRGGYGNYNRASAGEYGNSTEVDKYSQAPEYRASAAPGGGGWDARSPPPAVGRGGGGDSPWKGPPSQSAPESRDWSAAPGYPPPAPQQPVWSSQPPGYGGYQS